MFDVGVEPTTLAEHLTLRPTVLTFVVHEHLLDKAFLFSGFSNEV